MVQCISHLCQHGKTNWRKTTGTRRGTIPCNNPCMSTFSGFTLGSQESSGRKAWEFDQRLYHNGKSSVLTFNGVNIRPYQSPTHSSTSTLERSMVVQQLCNIGLGGRWEFHHPRNCHSMACNLKFCNSSNSKTVVEPSVDLFLWSVHFHCSFRSFAHVYRYDKCHLVHRPHALSLYVWTVRNLECTQ